MGRDARKKRKKAMGEGWARRTGEKRGRRSGAEEAGRIAVQGPQGGKRHAVASGTGQTPSLSAKSLARIPWLALTFHDKPEIDDMPHPHGGNNCTANRNVAHHGKAHSQKRGNGHKDSELRPQRHGTLGHIALKHHLVDFRAFTSRSDDWSCVQSRRLPPG